MPLDREETWAGYPRDQLLIEGSLWSADHARFSAEMERVDPFIDMYHVDVSDDHFVPGLLFFPDLVASLRPLTKHPLHVHLMTERLPGLIDDFARAGADLITVHCECGPRVPDALENIHRRNAGAGIALRLDSPVDLLTPYLDAVDLVLLMGTPLGMKGADLSPHAKDRIGAVEKLLAERGLSDKVKIEADGGIRQHTVPGLREAGADIVVMGSLLFKSADLAVTSSWVRSLRKQRL
jgi:ribulose-phosphate 3-epimerase